MTIEQLRSLLAEKSERGVTQVRIKTVLEALDSLEVPDAGRADELEDELARLKARRASNLVSQVDDNRETYGDVIVKGILVGTAEAAAILGVERPRIGKWTALGRMPTPVAELAAGPVWHRYDIEAMVPTVESRRRGWRREAAEAEAAAS